MGYSIDDLAHLGDEVLTRSVSGHEIVEPLDSPMTVPDVMRRFPEQIYQQGVDTHLYHFIQALCGESGAGLVAKWAYYARLPQEVSLLEFSDLDNFYTTHFNFKRLRSELYTMSPEDFNAEEVWLDARKRDHSYSDRLITFLKGAQLGGTPQGVALAASAGIGADVDIVENYNFIFDQYTDDYLGVEQVGRSISPNEFTLLPVLTDMHGNSVVDIDGAEISYTSNFRRTSPEISSPIPNASARAALAAPVKKTLYAAISQLQGQSNFEMGDDDEFRHLLPELEHNMLNLVDRLRPVGAYMSLEPRSARHLGVPIRSVTASSERFEILRFVTGRPDVNWPPLDSSRGFFIKANEERQAPNAQNSREWPIIFLTLDSAISYDWRAEYDEDYGSNAFYINGGESTAGRSRQLTWATDPPPLARYVSYHTGAFAGRQSRVLTLLRDAPSGVEHRPANAVAVKNTPLVLVGRPR